MSDPLSNIKLAPRAIRDLRHLDRKTRTRMRQAFEALGTEAANLDVKPVAGHAPWRRLRVGEHRVLYRELTEEATRDTWWHKSSTGTTYTAPSTSSDHHDFLESPIDPLTLMMLLPSSPR